MRSIAILAMAAMLIGAAGSGLAQDTDEPRPETDESAPSQAPPDTPADSEVSGESFTPSEEVEADTAVAFPTDI